MLQYGDIWNNKQPEQAFMIIDSISLIWLNLQFSSRSYIRQLLGRQVGHGGAGER